MARGSRARVKGRAERGSYSAFPHVCAEHPNYLGLSGNAVKLLHDMLNRYRGNNNGDISISYAQMKTRGWASAHTLAAARDELEQRGWIVRTTWATRRAVVLYALTFLPIDDRGGKLDVQPGPALGFWKVGTNPEPGKFPKKLDPLRKKSLMQKQHLSDADTASVRCRNSIWSATLDADTASVRQVSAAA